VIDTAVIVLSFLGGFILTAALMNDIDDDDNMSGGMMIPAYEGSQ